MKKKVLIILVIMIIITTSFVVFSETIDELKERFVTRDEWATYVNGVEHTLASIEQKMMIAVQDECEYQMFRRNILAGEKIESMKASDPSKYASMEARLAEDATSPYQY